MSHHHQAAELNGKEYDRSDSIGQGMHYSEGNGAPLSQTMTLSAEQFEKLYLAPKTAVAGDLRRTFGNPTPLGVMGFAVALLPLSISFMMWRGAAGVGAATLTASLWFGGVLLHIAALLEFFLGNTFPCIVFFGFGAHFLTISTADIPDFGVAADVPNVAGFDAAFGFYTLSMTLLSFIFMLCSLRTNFAFFLVFVGATLGFGLACGAYWALSAGKASFGLLLLRATGGTFFAVDLVGWYLLYSILLSTMDLPSVPLIDLSTHIRGVSERKSAKAGISQVD